MATHDRTLAALEAHLSSIAVDGVKTTPATSNPGPLGLFAFGMSGMLLFAVQTTLVGDSGAGVAYAFGFFFGGVCQLLAGLLEYQRRNTFACVAFISYGGFWISFCFWGTMVMQGVYPPSVKGVQMMLCMWGIYTFILWLCTFSTNVIFSAVFLTLSLLFFFLAGGQENHNFLKFAGAWGYLVAGLAWYLAASLLMEELYGKSPLPLFPLKPIHQISGGNLGTRRRVDEDTEMGKQ